MTTPVSFTAAQENRLVDLLERLSTRLTRHRAGDLPLKGIQALRRLADSGRRGSGQGELATALGLSHAAVSRLCDALEGAGLVAREGHPLDRRRKTVRLTDQGRMAASGADPGRAAVSSLSSSEMERLTELLTRLDDGRTPPARPFPDGRRRAGCD